VPALTCFALECCHSTKRICTESESDPSKRQHDIWDWHCSWLNQVERFFALLTERQLRRGVHSSVEELETALNAFLDQQTSLMRSVWGNLRMRMRS
jgi:hypothetical protein